MSTHRPLISNLLTKILLSAGVSVALTQYADGQIQPIVWTAPSLSRVAQTDPSGTSTSISLYAARGESESFQIIVRAPSTGLTGVDVTASNLVGPSGAEIPASQLTLYREYYTKVSSSSLDLGGSNRPLPPGMYPDGLIPFRDPSTGARITNATYLAAPFQVAANQNQPIWVDIAVPPSAVPGYYDGTMTVSSAQGSATISISLKVWNFTLPTQPALKSSFGFHGARVGDKTSEQALVQNRLSPFQINAPDSTSLSGQGLSATGLPFFSQVNYSACTISPAPSVASLTAAVQSYTSSIEKYEYAADEITRCVPSISSELKSWSQSVHAAGAKMLVTTPPDPSLYDDGTGSGKSAVDIWVLLPKQALASGSQDTYVLSKGDEIWSYNALVQDASTPKWELDFAPINYRIQPGFLNQIYGFTGLLYYSVDLWSSDPWNNPQPLVDGQFNYPGEGMLVYPGAQAGVAGVVPSMRLKWLRDGVDDFDYIQLLKAHGQSAFASQMTSQIGSDWSHWSQDPELLENVRIQIGEKLDSLNGQSGTPAPAPNPPASLQAPNNPWPASGSSGNTTSLTLQWGAVSGVRQYQVFFGDSLHTMSQWATINAPSVNYAIHNLTPGTTYYWKIVAVSGSQSAASPIWTFRTN